MTVRERDCMVMGVFVGCLGLCFLMLALPEKRVCEISVTKEGGHETAVHVGVVSRY